jgi:hypothetical protein
LVAFYFGGSRAYFNEGFERQFVRHPAGSICAAAISNYEPRLEQARADLAHIKAVISIFEARRAPHE